MQPRENIGLSQYSTMRLGGTAKYVQDISTKEELKTALDWALSQNLPVLMIGRGSNIIWRDEGFDGLLLINKIMGYKLEADGGDQYVLSVGAGEDWDRVVARTVESGLSGIECLSLIPGTAGATPIQNVGAYGQEIAQVLLAVEVYDNQKQEFSQIAGTNCQFGYRTSRFKSQDRGRFFITGLKLQLEKTNPTGPFYPSLQKYIEDNKLTSFTPKTIRQAVIAIRQSKLPDPEEISNNGSFFFNPTVDAAKIDQIKANYEDLVYWPAGTDRFKLSAAWLIDKTGFSDYKDIETGMATWPKHPLVLVNEHAVKTADLFRFSQKIVAAVQAKFDVTLEREPLLLP